MAMSKDVQIFRGELACESCYKSARRSNPAWCLIDGEPINDSQIFEDHCNYKENGHQWQGNVQDFEEHVMTCGYCYVNCNSCNQQKLVKELDDHMTNLCLMHTVQCQFCAEKLLARDLEVNGKKSLDKHLLENITIHAAITVSVLRNVKEENETLKHQLQNELRLRTELQERVEEQNNVHAGMKADMLKLQKKLWTVEKQFAEYRALVEEETLNLASEIGNEKQGDETKPVQDTMGLLDSTYEDFERKNRNIEQHFGQSGHLVNGKIVMIETNNTLLSANLSDLELKFQLMENTNYNGRWLWKIDNVHHRMQEALTGKTTALHSAPCFTSRVGYKFCCRLYLNGKGMGRGTHLSLFFVVMRSKNDALLSWPFTCRVTFKLINCENPAESIKKTFLSDRNSSSLKRPTRDMIVAAGCPLFVQKEKLFAGHFMIDDSLFIETVVTVPQ